MRNGKAMPFATHWSTVMGHYEPVSLLIPVTAKQN